ncbi:uncharacterized protein [Drosophila takahashii]|uniref:uncharacterized protein n=1 Tax=Drosophila takahashii TaxID=29030 RepID=UPI003898F57F
MGFRFSFVLIWLVVLLINGIRAARKWDYEPLSITSTTSDESLILFKMKIVRIRRGEYGISANVKWNFDTTNETMIEASAYRSISGEDNDYKVLPWSLPKQPFYQYLNTYYKDVIMKNFAHCTNIPVFKDKFEPPWPKKTYIGDKCVIDGDGLPEIAPPGYYKIVFAGSGPDQPSWSFAAVVKLTIRIF